MTRGAIETGCARVRACENEVEEVVVGGERGEGGEVVDEKLVLMVRGSASRFAFPSRQDLSTESRRKREGAKEGYMVQSKG